jgi:hypothetical protein
MKSNIAEDLKEYPIDTLLEKYKYEPFLTFEIFTELFKNKYNIWDKNIENVLKILFVKYIKRSSNTGLGLLDNSRKYGNIYFDFIQYECRGYLNSPDTFHKMQLDIIQSKYNEDQTAGLRDLLFDNYATKYLKQKYFDSFGSGNNYAKYNKNIDVMIETLNLLIQNNELNNKRFSKYYINFHTNLDKAGLLDIFGNEFINILKKYVMFVDVNNTKEYQEVLNDKSNTIVSLANYLSDYSSFNKISVYKEN